MMCINSLGTSLPRDGDGDGDIYRPISFDEVTPSCGISASSFLKSALDAMSRPPHVKRRAGGFAHAQFSSRRQPCQFYSRIPRCVSVNLLFVYTQIVQCVKRVRHSQLWLLCAGSRWEILSLSTVSQHFKQYEAVLVFRVFTA